MISTSDPPFSFIKQRQRKRQARLRRFFAGFVLGCFFNLGLILFAG